MLFTALPLAHQARGHVEMAGKTRLLALSRKRSARISLGLSACTGVRHKPSNSRIVRLSITPADSGPSAVS